MHAFPPWFSVSVCIIQLSCYQTLFDVGCKGYFSVRVRILSMSSDSLKSFLGRARCSISLLQTTLTLLSLAILNKRSTVCKISCTKCYLQSKCIQYTLRSKDKCTILYSQEKQIYSPFILEGEKKKTVITIASVYCHPLLVCSLCDKHLFTFDWMAGSGSSRSSTTIIWQSVMLSGLTAIK